MHIYIYLIYVHFYIYILTAPSCRPHPTLPLTTPQYSPNSMAPRAKVSSTARAKAKAKATATPLHDLLVPLDNPVLSPDSDVVTSLNSLPTVSVRPSTCIYIYIYIYMFTYTGLPCVKFHVP